MISIYYINKTTEHTKIRKKGLRKGQVNRGLTDDEAASAIHRTHALTTQTHTNSYPSEDAYTHVHVHTYKHDR